MDEAIKHYFFKIQYNRKSGLQEILTRINTGLIYFQHILQNNPGLCPIIFSISLAKFSVPYIQQTPAASTNTTNSIAKPGP
ncbi:unnamed protein product [Acanthoscelides obtectus]|uniref:Uncharacterized protein n=1 Tax=Acanthoscelides obtectus TaxID=200917 RepID=A0A9P0JXP3_ACAOB|nr:unnamed protein product [Acanthoscelides obtectus]CAK1638073.1 hypothetical protein AOBTE_LOCUS10372 [Acanthoscelides obtectus]